MYRGIVSNYTRTTTYRVTAYRSPNLADGVHQVRLILTGVVPKGSSGGYVSVDSVITR